MSKEAPRSREAQLADGAALWGKISELEGWYEHLPSKEYPMTLEEGDVRLRRQEEPTTKGGQPEVVTIVYKGRSDLTLCQDGRILVSGYTDVQSLDPEMYEKAVQSVGAAVEAIKAAKTAKVEREKESVRGQLAAFL